MKSRDNAEKIYIQKNDFEINKWVGYSIAAVFMLITICACFHYYRHEMLSDTVQNIFKTGVYAMGIAAVTVMMCFITLEQNANDRSRRILFGMQIVTAIDLLGCILVVSTSEQTLISFLMAVIFLDSPVIVLLFWFYQRIICLGNYFKFKWTDYLVFLLFICDCLFIAEATAEGGLFSWTSGQYEQGPWAPVTYLYPFTVLIMCIYSNWMHEMSFRKHLFCTIFAGCPMVLAGVALMTSNTIFSHMANVAGILFIYGGIHLDKEKAVMVQLQELQKMRIDAALMQINPHFIQNCLTGIRGLMYVDVKEAEQMLLNLAGYLRETFTRLDEDGFTSIRDEMRLVDFYLAIEQKRFPDSIVVEKDIDSYDFQIPSLVIETLVENAVRHGIREKEGVGCIKISAKEANGFMKVEIIDDGVGFDADKAFEDTKNHIGLHNVKRRIELMTGGSFTIESKLGEGTKVTLLIPQKEGKR